MQTETEIKKEISDYLKLIGYKVIRMPASVKSKYISACPPGTPDLLAIGRNGFSVWIEVKTETGRLSEVQEKFIADLEERGQHVLVVTGINQLTGLKQ